MAELRKRRARASDALPFRSYVCRGQPELSAMAVGGNGWDPLGERELAELTEHVTVPPTLRRRSCGLPGHRARPRDRVRRPRLADDGTRLPEEYRR